MDETKAREILTIQSSGELEGITGNPGYEAWLLNDREMVLDGHYTLEELEALVWWIRNKSENP